MICSDDIYYYSDPDNNNVFKSAFTTMNLMRQNGHLCDITIVVCIDIL